MTDTASDSRNAAHTEANVAGTVSFENDNGSAAESEREVTASA